MSKKKVCTVCGKEIEFCGHCKRLSFDELWRNIYCSEDCRDIFKTCSDYVGKLISIEDAQQILIKSNVKEKNIQMSVKNAVDEIINYIPKEEKKVVVEEKVIEEQPVQIEEQPKQHRSRRRRSKRIEE